MLKKFIKIILFSVIVISILTFSYATQVPETTAGDLEDTVPISDELDSEESGDDYDDLTDLSFLQPEIYEGDLFVFESNVEVNKLVNGNVFVFGNNVKISGQIVGNLFVIGNHVEINETLVQSSIFMIAGDAKYNAITSDLYAICNNLTIEPNVGVYRDLNVLCSNLNIYGIIGRNVNASVGNVSLISADAAEGVAEVYGDFNYSSAKEIEIPEGVIQGAVNYKQVSIKEKGIGQVIYSHAMKALEVLLFTLVVFAVFKMANPNFVEKSSHALKQKTVLSLSAGILAPIIMIFLAILLLLTPIGMYTSIVIVLAYSFILFISTPIAAIAITNLIDAPNTLMSFVYLMVVTLILHLLTLIPYAGIWISLLLAILGYGIIIVASFSKKEVVKETVKK